MRDMPVGKFQRVLDTHGFTNAIRVVEGGRHCFEARDGLRITPAYAPGARGERIDRRATIARIVDARRRHPLQDNRSILEPPTGDTQCVPSSSLSTSTPTPRTSTTSATALPMAARSNRGGANRRSPIDRKAPQNEEAPGAATPRASCVTTP
jgi:hypothetical protein